MKKLTLLSAITIVGLSACSATKVTINRKKAVELHDIQHICIIPNPNRTPVGYEKVIAHSLEKYNISSEIVDAKNYQRLYKPECPYNLRYISFGSDQTVEKVTVILRTPKYPLSTVGYNLPQESQYKTSPDLQKQTDGIIELLLNKKTQ